MASGIGPLPRINGYVFSDKIGSGSYADVYKAYRKNEHREIVAVKCVQKNKLSKSALDNLISEIEILKKLSHKNIVELKDFTWDDDYVYLIMEYCSGGALYQFIQKQKCLSERICQLFLQQLLSALRYLREENISHFDLKPQNILLASKKMKVLKIADFGLAETMAESDISTYMKGSPLYMAPEIVLERKYDARADIWSVGVILYECLFGRAPFSSKSFEELVKKIKSNCAIEIPSGSHISSNCRYFLKGCLDRNLSRRFNFEEFFSHPFVDLEHAVSDISLLKANNHLEQAIQRDKEGAGDDAFEHYNEAVRYLVPILHAENNALKRTQLRKKIFEYVKRMESLKKTLTKDVDISVVAAVSATLTTDPSYSCLQYKGNLSELYQLAKTTPTMVTALEIAETALLYEREGKYTISLDHYELALGKLLNIMGKEPVGRRRELLLEEINKLMGQAEQVKILSLGEEIDKDTESVYEADAAKTCCLQ